ncbi:hypothetical protein BU24DRAFT_363674 [Aaosphaeria arxii CBS 175.79]|uniref:Uncharacterized protein n=1 Tax=Aaosphaeria arxii CBS 175.79 TaxID=1450172 RepID=A0A6A5Y9Y6_9PLEO|nr:uncharacterized protein BU24DRAFT_363674 [Aaosphaeria arxii CBS 175.79]KAF2022395.1 hypothetical protein BU24DRAFT_363674 [Aaosphaeria arxii CBS 175.79]
MPAYVPKDPTEEEALELFKAIEEKFPSKTVANDKWYILLFSTMVGGGQPGFAPTLYKYLIKRPEYQTSEQRKLLMRRIRESLLKLVSIAGVCKPLEAIFDIDAATAPEDKDYSFSREGWQADEANFKRGAVWQDRLYKHNQASIDNVLSSQRDFDWVSKNITYGLYLSDHSILDDVDTELVVLGGIMIQNLPRETGWHLRGTRRIGVSKEDVETIQQCIELVGDFCSVPLHKVPRVADIEHEV